MGLSLIAEIEQTSKVFESLLPSQMVTAVLFLNSELKIQYANAAAEALLSKSRSKLFQQSFENVFVNTPIASARLQSVLDTGEEFNDSDVIFNFLEQPKITVEITASAVEYLKEIFILLEFKQIDNQKQISAEAFQQQQWESARDLIKGLAHEIKNPLGGLRGAAQLLNNELSADQQEYTAMIIEQADRLTNLVDRLLGPNQLPKFELQNIHLVLEKVYQLASFDNPKNIALLRDYDPSIPDILFDADKLQQAILNIVNNAVQAVSSDNSILLKTRIASNQTIHGKRVKLCVQISIIDNGPGIPAELQDTIFYPMVSGRSNGTGLGLAICQTLIHQHGGKLYFKSRPAHTEFCILLPISEESFK